MKSFSVIASGCEALECERRDIERALLQRGLAQVGNFEGSDILIVMGCSFTQHHEDEFRSIVERSVARRKKGQFVIVSGCYLTRYVAASGVVFARKDQIEAAVSAHIKWHQSEQLPKECDDEDLLHIPFVMISEGCYGKCSFCSIRLVRGKHKSRPAKDIVGDVRSAFASFGKAKLVGQDIAAYGRDSGSSLPELIRRIDREIPGVNLELGSLGPSWLIGFEDSDLKVLTNPCINGNIHVPFQSASNKVLARMNRMYTAEQFESLCSRLRGLGIRRLSTDIIAGFPGESEWDHEANLNFLAENRLEFAQIFVFEPRPGTEAAWMPQLERDVKVKRCLELIGQFVASYVTFHGIEEFDASSILNTNIEIGNEEVTPDEG